MHSIPSLFKFATGPEAAANLLSGTFKFSDPAQLNDPSELRRRYDRVAVSESLEELRKLGHSDEQFEWLQRQFHLLEKLSPETRVFNMPIDIEKANELLLLPVYDNEGYMEQALQRTLMLMRKRTGILSLTERFDSLPMWAHYAANASGYVVEYNGLYSSFTGDLTGTLNCLKKATYHETIPGLTFDPKSQDNVFFRKHADWAYEREWRVAKAVSDCKQRGNIYLYESGAKPQSLTLGWNMDEYEKRRLKLRCETICDVFEARVGDDGCIS